MSQLLFRLSKLSSRNSIHRNIRLFSTSPYLTLCTIVEGDLPGEGDSVGEIALFDPAKEKLVTVPNKTIPEDLIHSTPIGASHGWGFYSDPRNRSYIFISDYYNPLASPSHTSIIPLPPLTGHEVVWNVAMSYQDDACVVAVKFLGYQLSMCSVGRDLNWTHKKVPFVPSENSNLMYSKRDQRFSLPTPGGNYLCSWDLNFDNDPKFNELVFLNVPELPQSEWERLDSCFREDHWVESHCGQSFLVRWYSHVPSLHPMIMVFREDQETKGGTRKMCYTEDIGDLCIFLSKSEPFCVAASSCPGLKPNSIYLMGRCFAVYDLTTKTTHHFKLPKDAPKKVPFLPFWLSI